MSDKKKLNDEELENVNGGFFVVGNGNSNGSGSAGNVNVTVSHYCKACSHSWTADHVDEECPECGSRDLYVVVS